jgi:hypothetical protein
MMNIPKKHPKRQHKAAGYRVDNYKPILLQPKSEIEASKAGVHNRDRALALNQYRSFLDIARGTDADLVVSRCRPPDSPQAAL